MDKYDLLEAMSGIRDQYIEEAGREELSSDQSVSNEVMSARNTSDIKDSPDTVPGTVSAPEAAFTAVSDSSDSSVKDKKQKHSRNRFRVLRKWAATIAALFCLSILLPNLSPGFSRAFRGIPVFEQYFSLVTFRENAGKTSESSSAMQAAGEDEETVTVTSEEIEKIDEESVPASREEEQVMAAGETDGAGGTAYADSSDEEDVSAGEYAYAEASEESYDEAMEESYDGSFPDLEIDEGLYGEAVSLDEALSSARIEDGLREKTRESITDYEKSVSDETGDDSLEFTHIIKTDSDEWFCVAVTARSSDNHEYTQTNHFVFNKKTGEPVTLATWFGQETDYTDPLNAVIINQMREQMAADPYMQFWLEDKNKPESADHLANAQKTQTDEKTETAGVTAADIQAETVSETQADIETETDAGTEADAGTVTDRLTETDQKEGTESKTETADETKKVENPENGNTAAGGGKKFSGISPDQDFYIDEEGNLVICFDENEVAPVYMGNVEFTIPEDITDSLGK